MGFENRDYFRDGSYSRGGNATFMADAPMCRNILVVTVVVFLAQIFFTRTARIEDFQPQIDQIEQTVAEQRLGEGESEPDEVEQTDVDEERGEPAFDAEMFMRAAPRVSVVQDWLELDTEKVIKRGQIWRLITTAFCHQRFGIWHIAFNMLFLYWFGQFVEATYGSKEFLCFYLVAALVASFAYIGLELATGDRHPAIGASGAVMGVVCLFAMWNPNHTIRVYFLFPVTIKFLLLFYVIYDLHPVLLSLAGTAMYSGVAHAAHLGGLLFGFLYYKNDWRLAPYWDRWMAMFGNRRIKTRIAKSNFKMFQGDSDDDDNSEDNGQGEPTKTKADLRFDEQLDEVLRKISEHGQDSLTEREKKILIVGSQRYRKS